jgi:hypothetical protein
VLLLPAPAEFPYTPELLEPVVPAAPRPNAEEFKPKEPALAVEPPAIEVPVPTLVPCANNDPAVAAPITPARANDSRFFTPRVMVRVPFMHRAGDILFL